MKPKREVGIVNEQVNSNGNTKAIPAQSQIQNPTSYLATESMPKKKDQQRVREDIGVILRMQKDLFDHGRQRARERGALEPDSDDLRALESHARAIARDAYRTAYNPAEHAHDQLLDDEYIKQLKDRDEAEQAVKYALAALKEREEAAAQAHPEDRLAEESWALPVAAVVAIGISAVPTLHDFVFVMSDEFFSWTLSMLSGLFLGLLITLMILSDADSSSPSR